VDGTPILDVKPYIPSYDAPFGGSSSGGGGGRGQGEGGVVGGGAVLIRDIKVPAWYFIREHMNVCIYIYVCRCGCIYVYAC